MSDTTGGEAYPSPYPLGFPLGIFEKWRIEMSNRSNAAKAFPRAKGWRATLREAAPSVVARSASGTGVQDCTLVYTGNGGSGFKPWAQSQALPLANTRVPKKGASEAEKAEALERLERAFEASKWRRPTLEETECEDYALLVNDGSPLPSTRRAFYQQHTECLPSFEAKHYPRWSDT